MVKTGRCLTETRPEAMTSCRQYPDPYVLNSKGNVLASLGRWNGGDTHTVICQGLPRQNRSHSAEINMHSAFVVFPDATVLADARQDYLQSASGFQKARGFKDRDGSSATRLDGVFA